MPKKKFIKNKDGKFAGSLPSEPKVTKVSTNTKPIPLAKVYEKENGQIGLAGKKFQAGRDSGIAHERNYILEFSLEGIERLNAQLNKASREVDKAYIRGEIDVLKAIVKILSKQNIGNAQNPVNK
jgi:hypothetical protein